MMKKVLSAAAVTAAVFLLGSGESWGFEPARPFKFDVSVTAGAGVPTDHVSKFEGNSIGFCYGGRHTVEEMYADKMTDVSFSGLYSLLFEVRLAKRITVGGEAMFTRLTGDVYHGLAEMEPVEKTSFGIYIMPEFRFYYYMTRTTSLSGAVSAGAGFFQNCSRTVAPEVQVKPVALTVGGKVYGKAELSFGTAFNGVNFGIGYKF